jgi:hypothetical protein
LHLADHFRPCRHDDLTVALVVSFDHRHHRVFTAVLTAVCNLANSRVPLGSRLPVARCSTNVGSARGGRGALGAGDALLTKTSEDLARASDSRVGLTGGGGAGEVGGSLLESLWDEENTPRNAIGSTTSAATIPNRVLARSRLRPGRSLSPAPFEMFSLPISHLRELRVWNPLLPWYG